MSDYTREFGKHVKSLRRARGLTQDQLAQRSGLSTDSIRRIEHGAFAASIDSIRKLCGGLGIAPSTLWESFELGHADERRELFDLLAHRDPHELRFVIRVVRELLDALAAMRLAMREP